MAMAQECRSLSNAVTQEAVREQLLETAEQFERLARFSSACRNHYIGRTAPVGSP
jgi:hypothetical protein